MQSTIALFRHLYKNLPPLYPKDAAEKMRHALEHLENDQAITLDEIEDTMIVFGYEVWPWNQAYKEFLAVAESKVGEHFLVPKLPPVLQKKYDDFRHHGGTLRDLHSGRPADYFNPEERVSMCQALVELQYDLRKYVRQEVTGVEKKHYLARVEEFKRILAAIKATLDNLRTVATNEQDHPTLAAEIRSRVKGFEHGLCLLGPELSYEAIFQSVDFFTGRKDELNRLRGIHVPKVIDWYEQG